MNVSVYVLVAESCLTLCDSVDCSPLGSSVHGILQARILEWVAIPFSRGSSWPRDWTQVSHTGGKFFTIWVPDGCESWTIKKAECQRIDAFKLCWRRLSKSPLDSRRSGFHPWVRKILWRREWQSTPVLLPGESHRQRSLVGYSLWGCKKSDTTEQLTHRELTSSMPCRAILKSRDIICQQNSF